MKIVPHISTKQTAPERPVRDAEMLEKAKEFESVFIAQMLKHSGFEKALSADSGFGGANYASLLLERYAEKIVEKGGFGLTEKMYEQLKAREASDATDRIV